MTALTFNDKSHVVVAAVLDEAEEILVRQGHCEAKDANSILAREYVETVCGITHGSSFYVEWDEYNGANIFLSNASKRFARLSSKTQLAHAKQFADNAHVYFPVFRPYLRRVFLETLAHAKSTESLLINGTVMFAVAVLPEAITDIRREMRRRGHPHDKQWIDENTRSLRIEYLNEEAQYLS